MSSISIMVLSLMLECCFTLGLCESEIQSLKAFINESAFMEQPACAKQMGSWRHRIPSPSRPFEVPAPFRDSVIMCALDASLRQVRCERGEWSGVKVVSVEMRVGLNHGVVVAGGTDLYLGRIQGER